MLITDRKRTRNKRNKIRFNGSYRKIGVETDRDNANVGNNFFFKIIKNS